MAIALLEDPVMTYVSLGLWKNLRRAAPVQGEAIGGMVVWSGRDVARRDPSRRGKSGKRNLPSLRYGSFGKGGVTSETVSWSGPLSIPQRPRSGRHSPGEMGRDCAGQPQGVHVDLEVCPSDDTSFRLW